MCALGIRIGIRIVCLGLGLGCCIGISRRKSNPITKYAWVVDKSNKIIIIIIIIVVDVFKY